MSVSFSTVKNASTQPVFRSVPFAFPQVVPTLVNGWRLDSGPQDSPLRVGSTILPGVTVMVTWPS